MSYKMLVSDVDGTLIDDEKNLSEKNLKAIRRIIDEGIVFVIATGRMLPSAMEVADRIERPVPVIATNGSIITKEKQIVRSYPLAYKNIEKTWHSLIEEVSLFFYGKDTFYMTEETERRFKEVYRNPEFEYKKKIVERAEDLEGENVYKAFYYSQDSNRLDSLRNSFRTLEDVNVTSSFKSNIEVSDLRASKGNAVAYLAESLDIEMEEVIAIGDNHNDISMVERVGLGVGVDNACDQLKDAADVLTVSNNESPLAKIIEDYIL